MSERPGSFVDSLRNDTEGRAYYRRNVAAGKTTMEAMRATAAPGGWRSPLSTDANGARSCST